MMKETSRIFKEQQEEKQNSRVLSNYIQELEEIKASPTWFQIIQKLITFIIKFLINGMHNQVNHHDIYLMFNEFKSIL